VQALNTQKRFVILSFVIIMSSLKRAIDFRSDTLTKPTTAMRRAMFEAEVGDDVYGEDPTVNLLEERMAAMFGKEKALFFPTGTMSNLVAVLSWCQKRGSEVITGHKSHIYLYEQGGVSQFGGVTIATLPNNDDGTIDIDLIDASIKEDDFHYTSTELIAIENTQNECGGKVLPVSYVKQLSELCRKRRIPLHMDGARIWNAAVACKLSVRQLVENVDSISVCLSKGLGAPVGSVLIGPEEMINRARRMRKALGGGMRQCGIIAAAALQALDDFEKGDVIESDHRRTKVLAEALSKVSGLQVNTDVIDSNIILVKFPSLLVDSNRFVDILQENGILALSHGYKTIRLVVHRDLNDSDIDDAIKLFQSCSFE
jgi:threonine aldolase